MHKKTHRHFVAIPTALAALAAVAALNAHLSVNAELFSHGTDIEVSSHDKALPFEAGASTQGVLQPQSVVHIAKKGDEVELVSGEAVIRSSGQLTVHLGSLTVRSVANAVAVLRDASSATVVPLVAPVLVRRGDLSAMIAPGQQLIVTGDGTSLTPVSFDWFSVRFGVARGLIAKADPSSFLSEISAGTISGDDLMGLFEAASSLDTSGELSRMITARLLTEGATLSPEAAQALVSSDRLDSDLQHDMVEALPAAVRTLRKPVADAVMQAWTEAAVRTTISETGAMLRLVHGNARLPSDMENGGYPKQARLWRESLLRVTDVLRTVLLPEEAVLLDRDIAILTHGPEDQTESIETVPQIPESERKSADELVLLTRRALLDHGVLMGSATELTPDTDRQVVDVAGVLIAEGTQDVPYEFSYDPTRERVSGIKRDGKSLPNAVPAATFFGQ